MNRPETLRRRTRPTRGHGNDQPSLITRASSELLQLEQLAGELIVTAFNLPPGLERRDSFMLIDSFPDRIAVMKRSGCGGGTGPRRGLHDTSLPSFHERGKS
jgi:hypothetical protein